MFATLRIVCGKKTRQSGTQNLDGNCGPFCKVKDFQNLKQENILFNQGSAKLGSFPWCARSKLQL